MSRRGRTVATVDIDDDTTEDSPAGGDQRCEFRFKKSFGRHKKGDLCREPAADNKSFCDKHLKPAQKRMKRLLDADRVTIERQERSENDRLTVIEEKVDRLLERVNMVLAPRLYDDRVPLTEAQEALLQPLVDAAGRAPDRLKHLNELTHSLCSAECPLSDKDFRLANRLLALMTSPSSILSEHDVAIRRRFWAQHK